jgi:hypothetical protein
MNTVSQLLQQMKVAARARREAAQIASGDAYADLDDVFAAEQGRGEHFFRDGVRLTQPVGESANRYPNSRGGGSGGGRS